MAEIKVEGLVKHYGNSQVLREISFSVADGQFAVLLGPSGCGKTTLLRCVAGLERIDGGSIYIGDEVANNLPPRKRDLAMVFQNFALFPLMSARENIAFPISVRGASKEKIGARVMELAKLLGIEELLDKTPRELAGGEQQRVAIGRALARGPKAFLMDEPLSNLDAPLRAQLRSDLKRIQREIGVTTLYVTHDQGEAFALADKVGVMSRGSLIQYDSPHEVFRKPSTVFVARFVGDPQANIISVELSKEGVRTYLRGDGFRLLLPEDMANLIRAKTSETMLTMGVRPEDIELSSSPEGTDDVVEGTVRLDEPLTLNRLVTVTVGGTDFKVLVSRDLAQKVGKRVWLRISPPSIHVFTRRNEDRVL